MAAQGCEAILSFESDGAKYFLLKILDPIIMVGRQASQHRRGRLCRRHSHHCGANRFFAALRQVSTSNFEVPDEATVDKVAPALEDLLQSSMDAVFGGPDGEPFDEDDD